MCGIAGFSGLGDQADLGAMTASLTHRGPDGEGQFFDAEAQVYLGHRRLAIIDHEGGRQPMWNDDRSVGVVFNGEIYNHRELRALLEARGHVFRSSHSDTEILVHGYREWGESLPSRLNGMFAFAVYDRRHKRLFLARDRFGEKPLYYYRRPRLFAFASEITALRKHRAFSEKIDQRALQKFFAFGFVPAPDAIYEGVAKLPGGHCLTLDVANGQVRVFPYWRFRIEADDSLTDADEERLAEELRHLLAQAVGRRLMSDVPLGIFLSGGIDSAAVLATAARHLPPARLRTFTVGFTEPSFDESAAARQTAEFIGSSTATEILDLESARRLIPDVLKRLDEPLADPSIIPTYLLSRFTRRQVAVALSGDGGDELFAGYDPFSALAPAHYYHRLMAGPLHRGLRRLADLLPLSTRNMSWDFKIRRALTGLSYEASLWNPVWTGPVEPDALKELFYEPLHLEDIYGDVMALWEEDGRKSIIDKTLEYYATFYLQDDILAKVDRASMMNSLESRAVFLDNDLVAFCQRLPARFKYRAGRRKYLLKRAVEPWLSKAIIERPKKGFGMPIAEWLRSLALPQPAATIDGMDHSFIERAWREHRAGKRDHRLLLWCWLSLQSVMTGDDRYRAAA
jgi:asparagine synthase (glutamine-hydrolysing)